MHRTNTVKGNPAHLRMVTDLIIRTDHRIIMNAALIPYDGTVIDNAVLADDSPFFDTHMITDMAVPLKDDTILYDNIFPGL